MLDTQDLLRTDIIDIINYYKIQQSESKSIHQWLIYLVHIFSNHVNLFTFLDIFICQCAGPYLSKDIGQWFESFSIRISGLYLQKYMDQHTGIVQEQVCISRYMQKLEDYISCSGHIFRKTQDNGSGAKDIRPCVCPYLLKEMDQKTAIVLELSFRYLIYIDKIYQSLVSKTDVILKLWKISAKA